MIPLFSKCLDRTAEQQAPVGQPDFLPLHLLTCLPHLGPRHLLVQVRIFIDFFELSTDRNIIRFVIIMYTCVFSSILLRH